MNIVTIDFDIIMHPSLNLYNNLIDDENTIQSILLANKDANFVPNSDLFLYDYLTEYVLKCLKRLPENRVFFIDDHNDVLDLFEEENFPREEFNVINIDFHHDIAYDDEDVEHMIEEADCGNWVKYLFENNPKFKQYVWVKSEESLEYEPEWIFKKRVNVHDIKKYNLDSLAKTTDYLFLCRSPEWVPLKEQQLYETWINIVDYFYKK